MRVIKIITILNILLFSGCSSYITDKTLLVSDNLEELPSSVAIKFLNNNFKYRDSSVFYKDTTDYLKLWDENYEQHGETSCLFEKDKIYMHAYYSGSKNTNVAILKYAGFIPVSYENSSFGVSIDSESNLVDLQGVKYIDSKSESLVRKAKEEGFNAYLVAVGDARRKGEYTLVCKINAEKKVNIKKIGSALFSLGAKVR